MTTKETGKEWLSSTDRAVSPVIGVILMVAITVILAAVIGTFVLDLGQDVGNSAPQASLQVSTDGTSNTVTLEHKGGDAVGADTSRVIVTDGSTTVEFTSGGTGTFAVGEEVSFDITTDPGNSSVGSWDSGFSEQSGSTFSDLYSGDTVTVRVIDTESQKVVFETDVTA